MKDKEKIKVLSEIAVELYFKGIDAKQAIEQAKELVSLGHA